MKRLIAVAFVIGAALTCPLAGCDEALSVVPDTGDDASMVVDGTDAKPDDAHDPLSEGSADADGRAPTPLRVLFIGNSYTAVNDVPGILARIAATAGQGPTIATDQFVLGGATLYDLLHADAGARIAERTWTHVVLQDQSMEPASQPEAFLAAAKQLGDQIDDAGARTTWFVTWARAAADLSTYRFLFYSADEMQDRLTMAYDEAFRKRPGSLLACVGEAFRASLRDHPEIVLHQPDYSHATIAGSYLAASTFYSALTGRPVPPEAEVPAGIDAAEAAALRQAANVGSECADVRTRGIVSINDMNGSPDIILADGGVGNPYEYDVAGVRIPARFKIKNKGATDATIVGQTLSGPFEWTNGAFPGGSGTSSGGHTFCSSSIASQSECVVSVSFPSEASGIGQLTLQLADAYRASASRTMSGTAGSKDRALLTVSLTTMAGETHPGSWANLNVPPGQTINLVVTNRGGAPTTAIGEGQALASPFIWGTPGAEGFPGGSGFGSPYSDPSITLPYCGALLGPGEQCLIGIAYTAAIAPIFAGRPSIAYVDAKGPAAANVSFTVQILSPPSDAGVD